MKAIILPFEISDDNCKPPVLHVENDRLLLTCYNEGGYNSTTADLSALFEWATVFVAALAKEVER